ncbi:MAG: recombination protein NinG [Rectinema sp.]
MWNKYYTKAKKPRETGKRRTLEELDYNELIGRLDKEFSCWIRHIHQIADGYCKCYTCGKIMPLKEAQAGHFVSRRYYNTRYHPDNVRPQCAGCNGPRAGEPMRFRINLCAEIGEEKVRQLENIAVLGGERHLQRESLIIAIKMYREKNKKWKEK